MHSCTRLIPLPMIALLAAAAMLTSSLAHAGAANGRVCMYSMKACEAQVQQPAASQPAGEDSCCRKSAPVEPGPKAPTHHCPCCITICSTVTWAPPHAGVLLLIDEPASFSQLTATASVHGFDWVGDLFRPPCL